MVKVEAPTLQEAYEIAASKLGCSVSELELEVIQYPTEGFLGLFKKNALIVATRKITEGSEPSENPVDDTKEDENQSFIEEAVAQEVVETVLEETTEVEELSESETYVQENEIVERFFEHDSVEEDVQVPMSDEALAREIETQLKALMDASCFDIDTVEVDVENNTALIFIDGEDAALLIGKEGYRYNALSYMLFNWIHDKYDLYIKLEIAQFYTSQQEMMRHYLQPLIENIQRYGKGKTRFLDGILVQIALEQLREAFPNKYVAIKTSKNGQRFVVVNDFYPKHHD